MAIQDLKRTQLSFGRNGLASLTPIFAVIKGDHSLLHDLLSSGVVDPNECDSNGRTALHIAASKGNFNAVSSLLYFGADPNIRDAGGSLPLWEAILGGNGHAIRMLIVNDATLPSEDIGRYVCMAAEQNNIDLLKEIIRYGFDVMQPRAEDGRTAIDIAVHEGNFEIFHLLLNREKEVLHFNPDALSLLRLRPLDTNANNEDNTNANNEDIINAKNEEDAINANNEDTNSNSDGSIQGYELGSYHRRCQSSLPRMEADELFYVAVKKKEYPSLSCLQKVARCSLLCLIILCLSYICLCL